MRAFLTAICCFAMVCTAPILAAETPLRVLMITDSGGFIHDSVGVAETVMKEIGPKNGFEVDCYRFTRDPKQIVKVTRKAADGSIQEGLTTLLAEYADRFRKTTGYPVEEEHCGRLTPEVLKKYQAVFMFTTGNPFNPAEVKLLVDYVKNGGGYAGTHCASDTLYQSPDYGALVGGYFINHPWHKEIIVKTEDPQHPAGKAFLTNVKITDEIYQFREPYSRDKLHIILSVDNSSIDLKNPNVKRTDNDFALSWCQEFGKGRSFYTALGHRKEVWRDTRFQEHIIQGLLWAMKQKEGSAVPSGSNSK